MRSTRKSRRDHLEHLFQRLVHDWGFGYLKLDFVYAGSVEGERQDNQVTRAQALRAGLEAIRRGAGEGAFILGCGCPIGPAIGIVDGMRIGPDVAPYWENSTGSGDPSTALALKAVIARSWMHRRLWLNDPDCLMLRTSETQLTPNERNTLAAAIAGSGAMMLLSDDMKLLGDAEARLFQASASLGAEIDKLISAGIVPDTDLLTDDQLRVLRWEDANQEITLVMNLGVEARSLETAQFGTDVQIVLPVDSQGAAPPTIEVPSHGAVVLRAAPVDEAA